MKVSLQQSYSSDCLPNNYLFISCEAMLDYHVEKPLCRQYGMAGIPTLLI